MAVTSKIIAKDNRNEVLIISDNGIIIKKQYIYISKETNYIYLFYQ